MGSNEFYWSLGTKERLASNIPIISKEFQKIFVAILFVVKVWFSF